MRKAESWTRKRQRNNLQKFYKENKNALAFATFIWHIQSVQEIRNLTLTMKSATRTPRQIKTAARQLAAERAAFGRFNPEDAAAAVLNASKFNLAEAEAVRAKCYKAETLGIAGGRDAADEISALIARRSN